MRHLTLTVSGALAKPDEAINQQACQEAHVMAIAAQIFTLAGVALGAMASFITTSLNERSRTRREQALRWRDRRIDAYSTYVNDIKHMSAVARRVGASRGLAGRPSDLSAEEGARLLVEAEMRRSLSSEVVTLIGGRETVEALRLLNRTVWDLEFAARGLGDDNGPEAWDRTRQHFTDALDAFHRCVRRELEVPGDYLARDPEWQPPWAESA